jgi:L-aspartate oxidase
MQRTGDPSAYLDVTHLGADHFRRRFPTISRVCGEFGIDVGRDPIPVSPAAHYLMGGVVTDSWGQTTLPGLYASGECACTGVHGANRLASNSLLEALVFSDRAVRHYFRQAIAKGEPIGAQVIEDIEVASRAASSSAPLGRPRTLSVGVPQDAQPIVPTVVDVREEMWARAGLIRDNEGLTWLISRSSSWVAALPMIATNEDLELCNLATLARLVAIAARERVESRGAHYRSDFPVSDPSWRHQTHLVSAEPITLSRRIDQPRRVRVRTERPRALAAASEGI